MKRAIASLLGLSLFTLLFMTTVPSQAKPTKVHKVWVCKYVGKPGVDERLKAGKNPISVDGNATVGTWFKDAQGRSYVLGVDDGTHTYNASDCPDVTPTPEPSTTTPTPEPTTTHPTKTPCPTTPVPTTTVPNPTTSVPVPTTSVPAPSTSVVVPSTSVPVPNTSAVSPSKHPSSSTVVTTPVKRVMSSSSAVAPPARTVPPRTHSSLASTGSQTGLITVIGLMLLALGTAVLVLTRRSGILAKRH